MGDWASTPGLHTVMSDSCINCNLHCKLVSVYLGEKLHNTQSIRKKKKKDDIHREQARWTEGYILGPLLEFRPLVSACTVNIWINTHLLSPLDDLRGQYTSYGCIQLFIVFAAKHPIPWNLRRKCIGISYQVVPSSMSSRLTHTHLGKPIAIGDDSSTLCASIAHVPELHHRTECKTDWIDHHSWGAWSSYSTHGSQWLFLEQW